MTKHWTIINEKNTNEKELMFNGRVFCSAKQISAYYGLSLNAGNIIFEGLSNSTKTILTEEINNVLPYFQDDVKNNEILSECLTLLESITSVKKRIVKPLITEVKPPQPEQDVLLGSDNWDSENDRMKKQIKRLYYGKANFGKFDVLEDEDLNEYLTSKNYNMKELLKTKYVIGLSFEPQYSNIFQNLVGKISNNPIINKQIAAAKQQRESARQQFITLGWNAGQYDIANKDFILVINKLKPKEKTQSNSKQPKTNDKQLIAKYTSVVQTLMKAGYNANTISDKIGMVNDAQWEQLSANDISQMLAKWIDPSGANRKQQQNNNQQQPVNAKQQQITSALTNMKYTNKQIQQVLPYITPAQWQLPMNQLLKLTMQLIGKQTP